ncbi:MAG: porin family protein [Lentimicrobium sp.]|nr:porin family protein [Lentimicrobium sp.]
MKRNLILIAALGILPVLTLFGQTEQGKVFLGISSRFSLLPLEEGLSYPDMMTLGFSTIKFKSDASGEEESEAMKFNCFNFTPKAGYFIIDNLALGLDINLGLSSMKETYDEDDYKSTGTMLSVGPFLRNYFPLEKALPYIEAGASLGALKSGYEYDSESEEYKSNLNSVMGGIGIAAPLGDKVAVDFLVGYFSTTVKDKEDNPDNERTVIGTLGLKFGVVVFL